MQDIEGTSKNINGNNVIMKNWIWIRMAVMICVATGLTAPLLFAQQSESDFSTTLALQEQMEESGTTSAQLMETLDLELVNKSVEEALIAIAEEANLKLMYRKSLLPEQSRVTLNSRSITLYDALWTVLDGTGLRYALSQNRQLVLLKMEEIENRVVQETVSGRVVDSSTGEALPGVNIVIQGTSTGVITDLDGRYELTVPNLQETLEFSYIGYQTQAVPIAGRTNIDISLEFLTISGDELVVTAFGIERAVKSLTYSTQDVSAEALVTAREPNVMTSLTGRVAGLSVTNTSGGPGAPSRINLRGNRSFTGDSQPLYVLDGVPIRGNPEDLSPDDITSINVLKGGNAAALYGSAAQNGVIVITTNRGQAGRTDVSFSSNFMMNEPNILIDFQNEYGQGTAGTYQPGSEFSFGPRMEGQQVPFWSPDPNHQLAGSTVALTPQPNNVRDVFQNGYSLANNITARLGGETTQAAFSYTYTDAKGIVPGNTLQRNNVSVRINSELLTDLMLDSRIAYTRSARTDPPEASGTNVEYSNPIRGAYRMPRSIQTVHYEDFEYMDSDGHLRQNFFNPGSNGGFNPYWAIHRNKTDLTVERVIAMTSLTYNFSESLSLMARGAYDASGTENIIRWNNDTYIIADNGRYEQTKANGRELNLDALLSYTEDLTQDWSVNANVGANLLQARNNSLNANTGSQGLTVPNLFALSNTQSILVSESIGSPRDVQSVYGFGQIGWRDAIYLDITGRNDWSSTLPADSRSYFYPSVGLSVVLSDLIPEFPSLFTFARLRASYAEVGSSAPSFALSRSASVVPGGASGYLRVSGAIPAEDLRPERTESIETGLDLRFMEGRLGLDVTYYQTTTVDQLFSVALPIGSGAASFFTNGGDVQNKGFEASLHATPVQTIDFNWDVTLNWNRNRNTVVSISDDLDRLQIAGDFLREVFLVEGRPFGETTSRGYERDAQGRVIVESNGIPRFTPARSDVVVSNFQPDWMGSVYSRFDYRNISVGFLIDHRQGGTVASMTNTLIYADGVTTQTLQGREGGLIFGENFMEHEEAVMVDQNGDPTGNPNTYQTDAESFWRAVGGRNAPVGEVFVEDATNTRLRELTIGYNFSQVMLSGLGLPVSNINLSLVGRNLFFIHRASENIDPDLMPGTASSVEGWEILSPPTTRSVGVNLKVDF